MADAVITTDTGISHDEVLRLLDETLGEHGIDIAAAGSDAVRHGFAIAHEDASTLAHHLRGIASLLPRIGLDTAPDHWIEQCVRALCEALAASRPTVPDGIIPNER